MPNKAKYIMDKVHLAIWCEGCKEEHVVRVQEPHNWEFNGNLASPTIRPSILVRNGHFMPDHKPTDPCWCKMEDAAFGCKQCHSFVTDGNIQYLSDCSHALAGQTVELKPIT